MPKTAGPQPTETTVTVPVSEALVITPDTSAEPSQPALQPPIGQRAQSQPVTRPSRVPSIPPPQLPGYDHDGTVLTSRGSG
ncbi:hypothetical protein EPR50_G00175200 [Perca flavescens]|uniref:Uncharacterized protein n=1 Tax=Perca flavescens TaxID=8167 RepID=A0A484CGB1_PERFV|nr:hypothetical protein EPR50_G00175200 [Perca flavescens]